MLLSMTAYGRASAETAYGSVTCEIRSVNHRFLDISLRMPDELRTLETRMRERLTKTLKRGKVEIGLKWSDTGSGQQGLSINEALLSELGAAASRVRGMTDTDCVIDAVRLLQWPGVVQISSDHEKDRCTTALQVFEQALKDFVATRRREGDQLAAMLEQRNRQLQEIIARLREHRPSVMARQREKMQARLDSLGIDADPLRLEQELVHAAQRLDIDEELDRLDAHCVELRQVLERNEPVGRRLDFLMQEFNRETNTIGSKSADQQTTAMSVDMKVLIEQMREQIQNIE